MQQSNTLSEKIVLITGAGSGLGQSLSLAFAKEGAMVIGIGRSEEKLKRTSEKINKNNFEYFAADVGNFDQVKAIVDMVAAQYQSIHYLYNNAAVYPKMNFLAESAEDFAKATVININGVANCCKAVLPLMLEQQFGRIFNVGSWADMAPIAESAAYSASKGAVRALTKAIAADVVDKSNRVQIHEWIPGHLNTQMSGYTGIDPAVSAGWGVSLAIRDIDKHNAIFDRDQEWQPPQSLQQKIKNKLLLWK